MVIRIGRTGILSVNVRNFSIIIKVGFFCREIEVLKVASGVDVKVLEFIKSTEFWPDKTFWNDRILFFEASEEKPSPNRVGCMLRNYGIQGILQRINGVIFGRAKDYSAKEKKELNHIILSIIKDEFNVTDITVITDVDFGHTDPKLIFPLGCKVSLDSTAKTITLMESPFEDE